MTHFKMCQVDLELAQGQGHWMGMLQESCILILNYSSKYSRTNITTFKTSVPLNTIPKYKLSRFDLIEQGQGYIIVQLALEHHMKFLCPSFAHAVSYVDLTKSCAADNSTMSLMSRGSLSIFRSVGQRPRHKVILVSHTLLNSDSKMFCHKGSNLTSRWSLLMFRPVGQMSCWSPLFCATDITPERFTPEASNLVGR